MNFDDSNNLHIVDFVIKNRDFMKKWVYLYEKMFDSTQWKMSLIEMFMNFAATHWTIKTRQDVQLSTTVSLITV